jgi:hypothetical protein
LGALLLQRGAVFTRAFIPQQNVMATMPRRHAGIVALRWCLTPTAFRVGGA